MISLSSREASFVRQINLLLSIPSIDDLIIETAMKSDECSLCSWKMTEAILSIEISPLLEINLEFYERPTLAVTQLVAISRKSVIFPCHHSRGFSAEGEAHSLRMLMRTSGDSASPSLAVIYRPMNHA
jgi:hypothetical protein